MLSHNFSDTVKSFNANDEAYNFMNTIKGTPTYWKRFLYEVLAMVKQLGILTFFMTLSCADLHWNELIFIIAKLKGENLQEEHINNMDFFERCTYLNVVRCAIWYHLYNLKNLKNTHGGVSMSVFHVF